MTKPVPFQTDPKLNLKELTNAHFACNLMCNMGWAATYLNISYTTDDVLQTIDWGVSNGVLDAEDTVLKVNDLHKALGSPYELKLNNPEDPASFVFPNDYQLLPGEVEILCLHREQPLFTHFVMGTGVTPPANLPWQNEIFFDPIGPWFPGVNYGSQTAKFGYLLSKRILFIPEVK